MPEMERSSRKIPVTERQFLWVQDDDKGEVTLHVGPTMVSPTAADRVVIDDAEGGFREDTSGRPQRMIELGDNQYAVLTNPLAEIDGGPNGRFRPGRNESRPLRNGTRSMIPGPASFYLRPGQRCEVRDAHQLAAHQYLVVKVYGDVDRQAPYFDITARSAAIVRATSESLAEAQRGGGEPPPVELRRGQLIVIRGLDTQFYIPPSGVDVLPEVDREPPAEADVDDKGAPRPQLAEAVVNQAARTRARKPAAAPPAVAPPAAPEVGRTRLTRNAVVLGEKEYCVLIDADGKREIKVGPARVFPGPYDTFMTVGSSDRVYDAYELLPQRALWLRVIAPIAGADLARKLPRGAVEAREQYYPGDEILLSGVSTFFVPFNEIEVLSPETGQAVVGNDHGRVFIEAIGIDQKSGIYVRDLATGEARLVRGKQSYLVDPRKEVQITRTVPVDEWNLWVAANEPHKRTQTPVTTPWALSIIVPNNTAVLVTSASARRVVEGPCVTLLGYEETLTPMALSTGTPKSDRELLRTCFLRTVGNRVSDVIQVETADFVRISVHVSYSVTFQPELKERWFNNENYIQVMVDHLRSIVRGRCRTLSLSTLWPQIHMLVRDTVLGERKEGGGRPGRAFAENGTLVTEVEVLSATIEARDVADLMQRVQTQSVTLQIGDRQAQETLVSTKLRAELDAETQAIAERGRRLAHQALLMRTRDTELVAREQQALSDLRLADELKARLEREALDKSAELARLGDDAGARAAATRVLSAAELEGLAARRAQEIRLIEAQSAATVAERNAVQKGLIEALTALGDKILVGEAAANMNLVSLFKGKDVAQLLLEVLGGTRVAPTLRALREQYDEPAETTG